MQNKQKGFLAILVGIVIALIVALGVGYAVLHTKTSAPAEMVTETAPEYQNGAMSNTPSGTPKPTATGIVPTAAPLLSISWLSETKIAIGDTVTVHGRGFSAISRLNFKQKGNTVTSLVMPESVSFDGTQITFKITDTFFKNGLGSATGTYELQIANVDCGNGAGLQCTTNIASNELKADIVLVHDFAVTAEDVRTGLYPIHFGGENGKILLETFGKIVTSPTLGNAGVIPVLPSQTGGYNATTEYFWIYKWQADGDGAKVYVGGTFGASGKDDRVFEITKIEGKLSIQEIF